MRRAKRKFVEASQRHSTGGGNNAGHPGRLHPFAVRGVFWRHYLDWAVRNLPFYFYFVLLCFWTFFFFFFAAPARRAIVANLGVVLRRSSRAANYLRAFRTLYNFAWTIAEAARYKVAKDEFHYEIEGGEFLDALGTGRGAIVLTAHMGNYDLGAALFAQRFHRELRMVRAPEPDRQTAQHLSASLEQAGAGSVKVAYNTEGTLLSFNLLNALRSGDIVSIQGDRVMGDVAQMDAQLFGQTVRVPTGPFILSSISGAPIFPLFIVRRGFRRYRIIVREPITLGSRRGSREEDLMPAVDEWCEKLQQVISFYWDQWFCFAPIFQGECASE